MANNQTRGTTIQGSPDSGRYFHHMAEFVGFTEKDAETIRETRYILEKYMPAMIGEFYAQLLRYPPTRKYFLKKDGTIDQEYLQLRMHHQANFWRQTASGEYDDEYARFVDYVGKAHTSRGADPNVYIPERYVIGMIGFVQHAISEALEKELHEIDPDLEVRAVRAWNLLTMVLLEMLSRSYGNERQAEMFEEQTEINYEDVMKLAVETYEVGLGMARSIEYQDIVVAREDEIPDGERKVVEVDGISIGVFHHKGSWYALQNSCLHRGGPVCIGSLNGDTLTCPWHGYQFNVTNGELLVDPQAKLPMYPVEIKSGEVHLMVPVYIRDPVEIKLDTQQEESAVDSQESVKLSENEFYVSDVSPGQTRLVFVNGSPVTVYNVDGVFYATQDECPHAYGPLSEGELDGKYIVCPWHFSRFDVTNGEVTSGPATECLRIYRVEVDGGIGRVIE